MEKYFSHIVGTPVVSATGRELSRVLDLCLNPDTGKVAGFLLAPSGQKAVSPVDIIDWNTAIIIHDGEDIIPLEEIHQIQKIQESGVKIHRNKVYSKDGTYLGKVINYAIHTHFLTLTKIVVARAFLGLIAYGKLIISSKDILEIKKDGIIVRNLDEPVSVKKLKPGIAPMAPTI